MHHSSKLTLLAALFTSHAACSLPAVVVKTPRITAYDALAGRVGVERRCTEGNDDACWALLQAHLMLNLPAEPEARETWVRAACDAGHGFACAVLAYIQTPTRENAAELDRLVVRSVALGRRDCAAGKGRACMWLAVQHAEGIGLGDRERAPELAVRGCELGDPAACTQRGLFSDEDGLLGADVAEATRWYRRACDDNDARGCLLLSEHVASQAADQQAEAQVVELRKRACHGGMSTACHMAADQLAERGDSRDAIPLYVRACELGVGESCGMAAVLSAKAPGKPAVANDPLFRRGCQLGHGLSCLGLAASYESRKEYEQALEASVRACTSGLVEGCVIAGNWLLVGRGTTRNGKAALALLERGCAAGSTATCEVIYQQCMKAPSECPGVDEMRSSETRKRCWSGDGEACEHTAYMTMELDMAALAAFNDAASDQQRSSSCDAAEDPSQCLHQTLADALQGAMLNKRRDAKRLIRRAAELHSAGCKNGQAAACEALAGLHTDRRIPPPLKVDLATAARQYDRACQLGGVIGCLALAAARRKGVGVDKDASEAKRLLGRASKLVRQGCAKRELATCGMASRVLAAQGAKPTKLLAADRKACQLGHAPSCLSVASAVESAKGKKDQAAQLEKRACELGSLNGCHRAAQRQLSSESEDERRRGFRAAEATCKRGGKRACTLAAEALRRGAAGEKDATRARQLYERSCRLGWLEGCMMYETEWDDE